MMRTSWRRCESLGAVASKERYHYLMVNACMDVPIPTESSAFLPKAVYGQNCVKRGVVSKVLSVKRSVATLYVQLGPAAEEFGTVA